MADRYFQSRHEVFGIFDPLSTFLGLNSHNLSVDVIYGWPTAKPNLSPHFRVPIRLFEVLFARPLQQFLFSASRPHSPDGYELEQSTPPRQASLLD